jgi:hypothetical protein
MLSSLSPSMLASIAENSSVGSDGNGRVRAGATEGTFDLAMRTASWAAMARART